jgi:hypothetical protein
VTVCWNTLYTFRLLVISLKIPKVKAKAIPVTGREGQQGCETSGLPHFLENRLADSGEVSRLTRRPPLTVKKIPGTHLCYRLSRPQGRSSAGKIRSIHGMIKVLL